MPADFPSQQTAAPTLEKAAPASASLQTASCQYVYKRYGELGAAMTANVITYRGKSAAREVGNLMDALRKSIGDEAQVGKATKKPVASAKPETKKGIGLVKAPSKATAKRKTT